MESAKHLQHLNLMDRVKNYTNGLRIEVDINVGVRFGCFNWLAGLDVILLLL